MSVTDQQPTKVGQRVQEGYTDSRGWVVELGKTGGIDCAVVEWDSKPVGDEDAVWPIDELRVVEVIRIDADVYMDPSTWSEVEQTTTGTEHGTVYKLKNGMVFKGIDPMRAFLLGFFTKA